MHNNGVGEGSGGEFEVLRGCISRRRFRRVEGGECKGGYLERMDVFKKGIRAELEAAKRGSGRMI